MTLGFHFLCIVKIGESANPTCSPPAFRQVTRDVAENVGVGTTVFEYTGFDRDGDFIRFVTLDDISPFSIPITGRGDVAPKEPLDFEKKTQHTLQNV